MIPSGRQIWGLVSLLVAVTALWTLARLDRTETVSPPAPRVAPSPPPEPRQATLTMERTFLGQGGTLAAALERLELPAPTRAAVMRAAQAQVDLRRLPKQTGVLVGRTEAGLAKRVAVRTETGRFLRLDLRDTAGGPEARAEWVELPIDTRVETFAGSVESSVAQALSQTTFGQQLTVAFADIFQWDVDLLVDPRPGDRFGIVYEVHRFGSLPDDLPSFGNAGDAPGQLLGPGRILAASYEGDVASARGFWVGDDQASGNYYDAGGQPLRKSFLKSPLNYRRISSGFSRARTNPVTRKVVPHHGVDFAADPGTPVVATADGQVASAGWDGALGKAVRIRHGSEYVTVYGHFRAIAKGIRRGTTVAQNQVIGYVGSTGRATGPHLHYTVIRRGSAINPLKMKNPPAEPLDDAYRPELRGAVERWAPVLADLDSGRRQMWLAGRDGPVDPWLDVRAGS